MFKRSIYRVCILVVLVGLFVVRPTAVTHAATITVDTTADDVTVNGNCTLREAIIAANWDTAVDGCLAGSGADTIILPPGTYVLTLAGAGEDQAQTGDLDISDELTISGGGKSNTTIDGNGLDRVFHVHWYQNLTITGVRITGGNSGTDAGSGIYLYTGSTLTLNRSRVTGNAPYGGIYAAHETEVMLARSRVDNNLSNIDGGGIYSLGTLTITKSTVDSNTSAFNGGGIFAWGTLEMVNSTVSGNQALGGGGGIFSSGQTDLYNVTISNNAADFKGNNSGVGGGVYFDSSAGATFNFRNSIIAGNADNSNTGFEYPDCYGTLTGQGYNLVEDLSGCTLVGNLTGNLTGVSPQLDVLSHNGGLTITQALLPGSPAIDAGDPAGCVNRFLQPMGFDQRDAPRPVDGNGDGTAVCDMGAFELQ